MPDSPTTLASMLREHRDLRGLTQAEASREIGVSTRAYRMYENGEIETPHADQRRAIARFLEMDEIELTAALNGLAIGLAEGNLQQLIRRLVQEELERRLEPEAP